MVTNNALVSFKYNPGAPGGMCYTIKRGNAYVELDATSIRQIMDTLDYLLNDAVTTTTLTLGLSGRFNNGEV